MHFLTAVGRTCELSSFPRWWLNFVGDLSFSKSFNFSRELRGKTPITTQVQIDFLSSVSILTYGFYSRHNLFFKLHFYFIIKPCNKTKTKDIEKNLPKCPRQRRNISGIRRRIHLFHGCLNKAINRLLKEAIEDK